MTNLQTSADTSALKKALKKTPQEAQQMRDTIVAALIDAKGQEIKVLDVQKLTDITDFMVVVTGSSARHLKTLAARVGEFMSAQNWKPYGVEGQDSGDWILSDYIDVVVHIMRGQARSHYDLEGLWDEDFNPLSQNAASLQGQISGQMEVDSAPVAVAESSTQSSTPSST